jgi:hypothetical protein
VTLEGIQAVTSILTVLAALAAGFYARRAAIYTKNQAQASHQQVEIAADALEVTRAQAAAAEDHGNHQIELARQTLEVAHHEAQAAQAAADRQVEESQAAFRRYEESRLDPLVPVVLATARYRDTLLDTQGWDTGSGTLGWTPLRYENELGPHNRLDPQIVFRVELFVTLENVSDQIARVDIVDPVGGETDVRPGTSLIIPPGDKCDFRWTRTSTPVMLTTDEEINDPAKCSFNLTFWVRDLGMSVRDTYRFSGDLRLFQLDGSRLIVRPEPEHTWKQNVAQPLQQRVYERLEHHRATTANFSSTGTLTTVIS